MKSFYFSALAKGTLFQVFYITRSESDLDMMNQKNLQLYIGFSISSPYTAATIFVTSGRANQFLWENQLKTEIM